MQRFPLEFIKQQGVFILIDWFNLAANALWIIACAIALAALSYASWVAALRGVRFKIVLQGSTYQIVFHLAGLLFALGMAGTAGNTIVAVLWLVLAVLNLILGIDIYRRRPQA